MVSELQSRPRPGSATLTRTRLLNAAEALFASHGFDGTRLEDIAMGRSSEPPSARRSRHCATPARSLGGRYLDHRVVYVRLAFSLVCRSG